MRQKLAVLRRLLCALFIMCTAVFGPKNAFAVFECGQKIYTSCEYGYYMTTDGVYDDHLSTGTACTKCPTGCTCLGDLRAPSCSVTVSYKCDINGSVIATHNATSYEYYHSLAENCEKPGYEHTMWYDSEDNTKKLYADDDLDWPYMTNKTFIAEYTPITFNVSYAGNGNTGGYTPSAPSAPTTCTYDATCVAPANTYARAGHTFTGWKCTGGDASCDGDIIQPGASLSTATTTSNGTIRLTAQWAATTSSVTLNRNGGSGGTASVTATYGSAMPSITVPTRAGYTFAGYYNTSATSGGTQYYKANGTSARTWDKTGAQTLYARWTKCPAGYYCPGNNTQKACPKNSYSAEGSSACYCLAFSTNGSSTTTTTNACVIESVFAVRTEKITGSNVFSFDLSAGGRFAVDWGDGSPIEYIERGADGRVTYTHKYAEAGDYIIEFAGDAEQLTPGLPAISFAENRDIVEVMGDLSALFPMESVAGMYATVFAQCENLTTISPELFASVHGSAPEMFALAFQETALTDIPNTLFHSISEPAPRMFSQTFLLNTELTEIPGDLFTNITHDGSYDAEAMFRGTFEECSGITAIPPELFANITAGAPKLFSWTFNGCTSLADIPGNLFANLISTSISDESMFDSTFRGCTGLSDVPSELFYSITEPAEVLFRHTFAESGLTTLNPFFVKMTGALQKEMFEGTFQDCTRLSGYVPSDMFGALSGFDPGVQMADIFAGTALEEVCPANDYQFITGFEKDWSGKVSCASCPSNSTSSAGATACTCTTGYNYNGGTTTTTNACVANKYSVKYNANGGSGTMSNSSHTYNTAKTLTANAFTRTGYTFAGWNTKADGTGTNYTNSQSVKNLTSTNGATVNLYAKWTANTYTVTYSCGSGTGTAPSSGTATYNSDFTPATNGSNNCKRDGYTFAGWTTTDNSGSTASHAAGTPFKWQYTANKTFTAQWTANTYSVKYNANGGSGTMSNSSHTYDVAKALTANAFTRTGYTFAGWNTKTDGTGTNYADKASVKNLTSTNGATVNLYAKWNATTNNSCAAGYYWSGTECESCSSEYYCPGVSNGVYDGGIKGREACPTPENTFGAMSVTLLVGNIIDGNYDGVRDSITDCATQYVFAPSSYATSNSSGVDADYNSNNNMNKVGLWFAACHWNTTTNAYDSNCGGAAFWCAAGYYSPQAQNISSVNEAANIVYSAGTMTELATQVCVPVGVNYWSPNAANPAGFDVASLKRVACPANSSTSGNTVNANCTCNTGYNYNGGTTTTTNACVANKYTITLDKNNAKAVAGTTAIYTTYATNVYLDSARSKAMTTGANGITKPTLSYTVTYDANGGSVSTSSATSNYTFSGYYSAPSDGTQYTGETYILPAGLTAGKGYTSNKTWYAHWASKSVTLPTPTRTGYTFAGWYDAATGGNKIGDAGASYTPTADVTLYAHWTACTYSVKYNANGGSGTMSNSSHTYNTAKTLTANAFTRAGCKFTGWNTKTDGTGTNYADKASVKNLTSTCGGTFNLYAVWSCGTITANNKTLTYNGTTTSNGTAQSCANVTVSNMTGATVKYKTGSATTYTTTEPTLTNVGTLTVNYEVSASGYTSKTGSYTCTMNAKAMDVPPPSNKTLTYTGGSALSCANVTVNVPTSGASVTYSEGTSTTYTTTAPTLTYPGSKTINYKVTGSNFTTATGSYTCTMNKAENPITLSATSGTMAYSSTATFTVKNAQGTLSVKSSNENVATAAISGTTVTVTSKASYGTATITVTAAGNSNYNSGSKTYSVTVNKGTITLNNQSATTAGTTKIYQTYNTNVYLDSARSKAMTTSANKITIPAKTGYTFGGYYDSTSYTTQYIGANGFITSAGLTAGKALNANGTWYAKWTNVTCSATNGTCGTVTVTNNVPSVTITCNDGYSKSGNADRTHSFTVTGTAGATSLSGSCSAQCNVVAIDANGGTSGSITTLYKKTGSGTWYTNATCTTTYTTTTNVLPTRTGYTLRGLYDTQYADVDSDNNVGQRLIALAGNSGTLGNAWKITEDTPLYAAWAKNCVQPSNGTCSLAIKDYGYTDYTTSCSTGYTISGNDTATPTCTANTLGITLNKNGGTGTCGGATGTTSGSLSCKYDSACTAPSWNSSTCNIHNGAKILVGWNTKADGSGTTYALGGSIKNIISSGSTTLYAKWATPSCNVTNGTGTAVATTTNTPKCDVECSAGYNTSGTYTGTSGATSYSYECKGNTITLKFANGGHGTAPTSPASCTYGSTFTMPSAMTATGYTFNKWTVNNKEFSAGQTSVTCNSTNLGVTSGTATITGTWTACAVGYYCPGDNTSKACPSNSTSSAGATACTCNTGYNYNGSTTTTTNACVANKYTITLDKNNAKAVAGTTAIYTTYATNVYLDSARSKAMTTSTNGITKPTLSYTVTYNANGGSVSTSSATSNYTFSGYYSAASGGTQYTGETYILSAGLTAGKGYTSNKTWYAHWASKSVTLPTPTRTGYTFAGWYDAASGGNKIGDAGASYTPTADVTLYSHWTACTYSVKYNANGGSGTMSNSSHTYDTAKALTANTFTRTGYTFAGWNTKADGTSTSYADKASVKNLTSTCGGTFNLYAKWSAKEYTVTYSCGSGTGTAPSSGTATYDSDFTPATNGSSNCKRDGYTFAGWTTTDNSGSTASHAAGTPFKWQYTANKTFTAKWTGNTITVNYNENGGDAVTNGSCTYGGSLKLSSAATKDGSVFAGWKLKDGTVKNAGDSVTCNYTNLGVYSGTSTVVTAQWTACAAGYYCPGDNTTNVCSGSEYSSAGAASCTACPSATGWVITANMLEQNGITDATGADTGAMANRVRTKATEMIHLNAGTYTVSFTDTSSAVRLRGFYTYETPDDTGSFISMKSGTTLTLTSDAYVRMVFQKSTTSNAITPAEVISAGATLNKTNAYVITGTSATDHDNVNDCKISCPSGSYVAVAGGICVPVTSGSYAAASTVSNGTKNSASACPATNSGSDSGRGANSSCYYTCPSKSISNGTTSIVNSKVYYSGSAYPVCTYTATCNDGYTVSGNNSANPECKGNTITLKFANGGRGTAPTSPASCTYGSTFTMPSAMTATGYTFNKWTVNNKEFSAGQTSVTCNSTNLGVTSGTATITGTWTANTYTVTLNDSTNGGSGGNGTIKEVYATKWTNSSGTTISSVTVPTKSNSVFTGYYTASSSGTRRITNAGGLPSNTTFTSDTTLYAQFASCGCTKGTNVKSCTVTGVSGNKCTYSYVCNDGYSSASSTFTGAAATGTNTSPSCTGNTITLKFANGGRGTAPTSPASCTYGSTFTMPSAMTATGYTFNKWTVNNKEFSAGQTSVTCNSTNLGVTSGTATITGTWTACAAGNYCPGDNTSKACPSDASGRTVTSPSASDAASDCYVTCPGSISISDGTTTVVDGTPNYNGSSYPACTYTVDCESGYGASGNKTGSPSCSLCGKGTYSAGGTNACAVCSGNTYNTTTGASSCSGTCPSGYSISGTSASNHDAKSDCKISCSAGSQVVSADATCSTPDNSGKTWGWYTSSHTVSAGSTSGTNVKSCSEGYLTPNTKTAGNHDASGDCELQTYTISYTLNGGTNSSSNPSSYNVTTATIALSDPSRSGYTFAGWYDASTGGNKVTQIAQGSTGNKTLYARWTGNTITVNYNENGGDAVSNGSCTYGGSLKLPSAATKDGSVFAGWKLKDGTVKNAGDSVTCNYTNLGVYSGTSTAVTAQWTACAAGYYCPGDNTSKACPAPYSSSVAGSDAVNDCYLTTTAGNYVEETGKGQVPCACGGYCSGGDKVYHSSGVGSTTGGRTACGAGTYNSDTGASAASACKTTDPGYYAVAGSCNQTKIKAKCYGGAGSKVECPNSCPSPYINSVAGSDAVNDCYLTTTAGNYVAETGKGQVTCAAGGYCLGGDTIYHSSGVGDTTGGRDECACGTYNANTGSSVATACKTTDGGYYSAAGATSQTKATAGYYAAAGACKQTACSGRTKYSAAGAASCKTVSSGYYTTGCNSSGNICTGQSQCVSGTYCESGVQKSCPSDATRTVASANGAAAATSCYVTCGAMDIDNGKTTIDNTVIYYTNSGYPACTYSASCNDGYEVSGNGTTAPTCTACAVGSYGGGNTAACSVCPNGGTTASVATVAITSCYKTGLPYEATRGDGTQRCFYTSGDGDSADYSTDCDSIQITSCDAKYYLKTSTATNCTSVGTGYYSATGSLTRTQCPANYRSGAAASSQSGCKISCADGTYVATAKAACVNVGSGYYAATHTVAYGKTSTVRGQCAAGLTTIGYGAGANEEGDCGRGLNVDGEKLYLRSVPKTEHSLHVKIGEDVFYGNMSTTSKNMSAEATKKLNVKYNGTTYYVHDDSVN